MKYIDAEKLKTWLKNEADIEFKKTEENANSPVLCHFHNGCRMQALDTIDFINSLQQEPPIHTELCTLIACDVIQSTAKKAIEKPQDKDKEEDLMIKKMEYLNLLEKSFFQQEQPEMDLEQEVKEYFQGMWPGIDADTTMSFTPSAIMRLVKHFYNFGKRARNPELSEISEKYAEKLDISKGWFDGEEIDSLIYESFIAGAEWQYQKDRGEFAKIKAKTWCEGFDAHKEQMLKEAVEADAKVCKLAGRAWITPIDEKKFTQNVYDNFGPDDRVRIIIIKEDKK